MRVIAGSLGGRLFDSPGTHRTHPMSDRMRGALFNMLGDLDGLTVLDAFAGSGALAFEAISRGATHAIAIESDKTAQKAIRQNIHKLGIEDKVTLISAAAGAWLATNHTKVFDIILCDPPYNDLQSQLLGKLAQRIRAGGIFVVSWPSGEAAPDFVGLELRKRRSYGDAQLFFFVRA